MQTVLFAKVMLFAFAGVEGNSAWRDYAPGWMPVIAVSAALSMVLFGTLWAAVHRRRLAPAVAKVRRAVPSWAAAMLGFPLAAASASVVAGAVAWILSSA